MKSYFSSFISFLKNKKYPNKEDLSFILESKTSISKIVLIFFCILVIASFINILSFISNKFSIEVPDYGGEINYGVIGSPKFINPLLANSETDLGLSSLVFAPLAYISEDEIKPVLAKECISSPDQKTIKCTLRENIYFSNKEPINSEDILFTFQNKKTLSLSSDPNNSWKDISINKTSDAEITLSTTALPKDLREKISLGIIPKALFENIPLESLSESYLNTSPISSGAFKVSEINYTNSLPREVVLVPNKFFPLGKPFLNKLNIKIYANQLDLLSALLDKEIDATTNLENSYINEKVKKSFNTEQIKSTKSVSIWGNKILNQNEIYKTLQLASPFIDKNQIIDSIENGYGIPLSEETSSNTILKKTNSLVSISTQKDESLVKTAEKVSEILQSLGIISTVQVFDQGFFIDQMLGGNYSFILTSSSEDLPGYQRLVPLYTKSFVHIYQNDIYTQVPKEMSQGYEALKYANLWHARKDRVWKLFNK